jgi:hypothetical protein
MKAWSVESNGRVRFVAFPATDYDEVLSGYQPGDSPREHHNGRVSEDLGMGQTRRAICALLPLMASHETE